MKKNLYIQVFSRLMKYKGLLMLTLGMLLLSTILASYIPVTIGHIIDACNAKMNTEEYFRLMLCLLFIIIAKEICLYLQYFSSSRLILIYGKGLREDCFKSVLRKNYQETKTMNTGEVIQIIFDDIDRINDYGINTLMEFISNIILAAIAFYNIAKIYLNLAIISTVVYLIYLLPTVYFGKKQKTYSDKLYNTSVNIKSTFLEKLETIKLIKTFGREKKEKKELDSLIEPWINITVKNEVMRQIFKSFPRALDALAPALIFIIGGINVFSNKISIGDFVMILTFLPCINAPIRGLSNAIFTYKDMEARLQAVYSLAAEVKQDVKIHMKSLENLEGNFCALNIKVFADRGNVLDVKRLEVKSGEKIAFVGETGSGKSTMLRILAGVQKPDEGKIYLDGMSIDEIEPSSYRKNFGVVLQYPYIFNETLDYNLMLSNGGYDEKEKNKYIELLGLSKEFNEKSEYNSNNLGEGGEKISGGQRQRVAILRCLISQCKVLFFDEGTSALDLITEKKVMELINTRLKTATMFYVAHRLETVTKVDRIYVFKNGKIVETGSHEDLLLKKGEYYNLWKSKNECET